MDDSTFSEFCSDVVHGVFQFRKFFPLFADISVYKIELRADIVIVGKI